MATIYLSRQQCISVHSSHLSFYYVFVFSASHLQVKVFFISHERDLNKEAFSICLCLTVTTISQRHSALKQGVHIFCSGNFESCLQLINMRKVVPLPVKTVQNLTQGNLYGEETQMMVSSRSPNSLPIIQSHHTI